MDAVRISSSVGRPRSAPRRREGGTPREEVLDAAAELFTQRGFAATSTRAIADAVGIKQASLYYHFASKEQILFDLLLATVMPSRAVAAGLARLESPADAKLWALAASDVRLLCSGPWNLGALYLLPELRAERFAPFHVERRRLREDYQQLVLSGVDEGLFSLTDPAASARLVFGLVEAVISMRQEGPEPDGDSMGIAVADGCLRMLGSSARSLSSARTRGQRLVHQMSLTAETA